MTSYTAYFYTDAEYAIEEIEASNPQQALEKARALNEEGDELIFDHYDEGHPVNQIEIVDEEDEDGDDFLEWQNDDLRLRCAAQELLEACRLLVAAYAKGAKSQQVDWEDLDLAHKAAQSALAKAGAQP